MFESWFKKILKLWLHLKPKLAEMLFIHAQKQYINNQQDTKTLTIRFEYKTLVVSVAPWVVKTNPHHRPFPPPQGGDVL